MSRGRLGRTGERAHGRGGRGNGVTVPDAYYTDICGRLLRSDGTAASGPATAARVGAGTLPTNNHTNPDCPNAIVGPVAGVLANATRPFTPYVARVIGFTSFSANTTATAVSGVLQGTCAADALVLPVTAPVTVVSCDGTGSAVGTATKWPKYTRMIIPLCKNNPGNVGWLDWTPKGGGTSELIDSILHPNNPAIDLPSWQYVTATGNVNSKGVEDALNTYIGQVVLFPLFDLTCADDPNKAQVGVAPSYGCGDIGGSGQNQWYRIPSSPHSDSSAPMSAAPTRRPVTRAMGRHPALSASSSTSSRRERSDLASAVGPPTVP